MLDGAKAVRLAALTGRVRVAASLERTLSMLPDSMGNTEHAEAHRILDALIAENPCEAAVREIEAELQVSVSGPWNDADDVREVVSDTARDLISPGSFEACALAFSLAATDVFVAVRKADSVGMVVDLVEDSGPRGDAIFGRFRDALEEVAAGRARLAAAAPPFRASLAGQALSPAVAVAAEKPLEAAAKPVPRFDGPESRQIGRRGESFWKRLDEAIWALESSFAPPVAPVAPSPPSPEEEDALAELLAHPDDDAARLRWAALAEARREPRAALVREQMKVRERRRTGYVYPHFEGTVYASLIERHAEWAEPVKRLGAKEVAFRRGFVEWIAIDAGTFLGAAAALYRAAPILHVKLSGAAPVLPDLVASGALTRLVSLDVSGQGLDDTHVEVLARAGLKSLRSLDLRSNRITAAGVRTLYTAPSLSSLVYCLLPRNLDLYEMEWTLHEIPTQVWVGTELGVALEKEYGTRRWAYPWLEKGPPEFDILTVPIRP